MIHAVDFSKRNWAVWFLGPKFWPKSQQLNLVYMQGGFSRFFEADGKLNYPSEQMLSHDR